MMTESEIATYVTDTFAGAEAEISDGSFFFFAGEERKFPFATLVTKNSYDDFSDLDRPGVFRLNIGITKPTFQSLLDEVSSGAEAGKSDDCDFAALDRLLPHPVYGSMFWVCVLNPSADTFATVVRPLLAEAYDLMAGRQAKRTPSE